MSKILIIEDEEAIADLEKDYLEMSGYEVLIENDGTKGLEAALKEDIDLLVLDLMLPGVDGYEICKKVREEKNIPILMVSAKKDDIDKIRGLGLGADDYMTKPFSPSELVARVKAHLSRYERLVGSSQKANDVIEIRGLKIDKTARRVFVNGEEKIFTTKEFDLLTFLAENPNHVFTKDELFRENSYFQDLVKSNVLVVDTEDGPFVGSNLIADAILAYCAAHKGQKKQEAASKYSLPPDTPVQYEDDIMDNLMEKKESVFGSGDLYKKLLESAFTE